MATPPEVTTLPKDRNLFAERVSLKLLELSKGYDGVKALRHLERARRFKSLFAGYTDVSSSVLSALNDIDEDQVEDTLVRLFWEEFGSQVIMPEAQARLSVFLPPAVKPNALFSFELGRPKSVHDWKNHRACRLSYLKMAPFELKGTTPNFADDLAIFDLAPTADNPNPVDLRPYTQFITAGTTISFYYPAAQHQEWFIFSRPYQVPPPFLLDKALNIIFAKQVSPDVNCAVYGVEATVTLQT